VDDLACDCVKKSGFGREGLRYAMEKTSEMKPLTYSHQSWAVAWAYLTIEERRRSLFLKDHGAWPDSQKDHWASLSDTPSNP
jgi:hypothetical protein